MAHFKHKELLEPPVRRAAYSDRTAWLMAELSRLAYVKFEEGEQRLRELKAGLSEGRFELAHTFNTDGTQGFLAKRSSDSLLVLAFRGTEKDDPRDVITDLNARFYTDESGTKIHEGFHRAFKRVEQDVRKAVASVAGHALYVTGHSLGGALGLMATRALNSDELAACYTFGSPKVGNAEFANEIKPPIYRVVNAYDPVPIASSNEVVDFLLQTVPSRKFRSWVDRQFRGYVHHGDMRYLTPCGTDFGGLQLLLNYGELRRIFSVWMHRRESVKDHAIDAYCDKLAHWALRRLGVR